MPEKIIVAIDGPAGSGKSTVSKLIAKSLGLLFIDTGAMYRALTLKAMNEGINLEDEIALTDLAKRSDVDLKVNKRGFLEVLLDGKDVSSLIRTPELTKNIKFIARTKGVRERMVALQRKIGNTSSKGAVLEGRDITTVVFPDSKYKFYLDASVEERAKRRYMELIEKGENISLEDLKKDIIIRDESDFNRVYGPLKISPDADYIDTSNLTIEEVTEKVLKTIDKIKKCSTSSGV